MGGYDHDAVAAYVTDVATCDRHLQVGHPAIHRKIQASYLSEDGGSFPGDLEIAFAFILVLEFDDGSRDLLSSGGLPADFRTFDLDRTERPRIRAQFFIDNPSLVFQIWHYS